MLILNLLPAACLTFGGGHAELHPTAPNFYLELPDTQAVFAAYEDAALMQLLHDDEVRRFAAKIAGEDPETFDIDAVFYEMLEELYSEYPEALLAQTLLGDVDAMSLSISGVELRGLHSLLSSSNFQWSSELDAHLAPAQMRLVLEFPGEDEAVLAKMFDTVTALVPIDGGERALESAQVASLGRQLEFSIWRNPEWMEREVFAARDGSRIVFGAGVGAASKFIAEASSLVADPDYARCAAPFAKSEGNVIYDVYLDVEGFSEVGALMVDVEDIPFAVASAVAVALPLIAPGDRFEWRSRSRLLDGRFITESAERNHNEIPGLRDVVGLDPVTPSSFQLVPAEAVAVWATTVDKQAMGDFLVRAMAQATGDDPELFLAELEDQFGLRPRRDIIDSLGESLVFYTMPFSGIGAPKMFIALDLSDAEAFARGLEALGETAALVSDGAVEFRSKPYRKSPFMSFAPAESIIPSGGGGMAQMAPALFSPSLAVGILEGRAIVSLSNIYTKREMKRMKSGEGATHPLASADSALPSGVVSFGSTDWGGILDSLYAAVKGMLPLVQQGMGGELPFDLADLPADDIFSRYITPTTSWSRRTDEGHYNYNESSFGPEIPMLLSGTLFGALFAVTVVDEGVYEISAEVDGGSEVVYEESSTPTQATRDSLSSVKVGIVVYKSDLGSYPATLAELAKPSANFPDGYLEGPEVPTDAWRRALNYKRSEDGSSFRVWSSGPDGIDNDGAGDDVNLGKRR